MGVPKSPSLQEFLLALYEVLFTDLQRRHPAICGSLTRDLKTIKSRVSLEGPAFATKTLPKLGKALDRALVEGRLEAIPFFSKKKGSRTIPAFLQGMFSLLFTDEGLLVGDSAEVIRPPSNSLPCLQA